MKTLYDPATLEAIDWAVTSALDTEWAIYYSPACTPPLEPRDNLVVVPLDVIPPGRVLVMPVGDRPKPGMRAVTAIHFHEDRSATIEYETRVKGASHITAVHVAGDVEEYADEVETIRAHAGMVAGAVAWREVTP